MTSDTVGIVLAGAWLALCVWIETEAPVAGAL